jgi:hypothetical protein
MHANVSVENLLKNPKIDFRKRKININFGKAIQPCVEGACYPCHRPLFLKVWLSLMEGMFMHLLTVTGFFCHLFLGDIA